MTMLAELRRQRGLAVRDVALILEVHPKTVATWERTGRVTAATVRLLAIVYQVATEEVWLAVRATRTAPLERDDRWILERLRELRAAGQRRA